MNNKENGELADQEDKPWTARRCLSTSVVFAIFTIYMLLSERTIGRSGGFTPQDDPYWYWGCVVIFGGIAVYLFATYIDRRNRN